MKPVDLRNETWADIQGRVTEDRQAVYERLQRCGPCTTRDLADLMQWDILNVRPRVTELCDLFLAECVGKEGREGLYMAVPWTKAQERFERAATEAKQEQMMLL